MKRSVRILTITTTLLCCVPTLSARAQSPATLAQQFEKVIAAEYKPDEPGGVALVSRGGKVIYERAFGMANYELKVPMQKNSVFCIASMTKQFTAIAVLQLVEKGTIALTDTVGKFLPDYPQALKGITIEQLLTHTSGVMNPRDPRALLALGSGWLAADQIMAAFKDQPLGFTPGSHMEYSNAGYQLLGYIVEKVTGEPYPEFVEKTLLKPAGMEDSFWGDDTRIVPNRASPYLYTRNGIRNAVNANVQIAFAAGAIQSTARDFMKWHQALLAETFVKRATLEKAWTPGRLADGTVTDYGYGWFVGDLKGSRLVEHGGNMGGFMSHSIYLPREDILVVVLLNSRGKRLPELVATDLAAIALGKPLNFNPVVLPPELLQSYAGVYSDARGDVAISVENGKMFYQRTGGIRLTLVPYARDKFYFENTSILGEAIRNSSGDITGFGVHSIRRTKVDILSRRRP